MKRLSFSDSSEEEKDRYEEEDGACSYGQPSPIGERKRRLSVDQVKALEKNFEADNKLDPERKVTLAREVGLRPRQVAVWFQNRRARRKAKQLERDYGELASRHDALMLELDALRRDKEALQANVEELRADLARAPAEASKSAAGGIQDERRPEAGFGGYRDSGSDSSDSSVAFSDGMAAVLEQQRCLLVVPPCFLGESRGDGDEVGFSEEPFSSNFFSEEQPPWYCSEGWDWGVAWRSS